MIKLHYISYTKTNTLFPKDPINLTTDFQGYVYIYVMLPSCPELPSEVCMVSPIHSDWCLFLIN